jgi:hypothetical protein
VNAGDAAVELCVLLWPQPGRQSGLVAYEDAVLALVAEHGGEVLQRARTSGESGAPLELQTFRFPDESSLTAYMTDPRRLELSAERDRVVARTELYRVTLT